MKLATHTSSEYNFGSSSPTWTPCAILGHLIHCHCHRASPPTPWRAPGYTIHGQTHTHTHTPPLTCRVPVYLVRLRVWPERHRAQSCAIALRPPAPERSSAQPAVCACVRTSSTPLAYVPRRVYLRTYLVGRQWVGRLICFLSSAPFLAEIYLPTPPRSKLARISCAANVARPTLARATTACWC